MTLDADRELARLRSLAGVKWSRYDESVIPAFVADMDIDQAPPIKDAMRAMIDRGDLGYNPALLDQLVPAWLRWCADRYGLDVTADRCRVFPGVLHALEFAMTTCTEPGDGVVLFSPVYYPFRMAIADSGRRVVDVPLGDDFVLDAERLIDALDAFDRDAARDGGRVRAVLVCQPHNPVGRVFGADSIRSLADVAERRDLVVISDEIWADIVHPPTQHLPLIAADDRLRERTVTIGSASKAFNLSGLRCAVAHVGPTGIREVMDDLPIHLPGGPSTLSAAATVAAWEHGGDWLTDTMSQLTRNRDHVIARLRAELPEVEIAPPDATYLAWLDLRATTLGDDPARTLVKKAGLALSSGPLFGVQGRGHARLNFGTNESILDEILDRLIRAIQDRVAP